MGRHEQVLALSTPEFNQKVELLEAAFANRAAAFYFDGNNGNAIDVFDLFDGANTIDEWSSLRSFADDVQPLIFYAFQGAPDLVIHAWGEDHTEGAGEIAVERVEFIRKTLYTGHAEWNSRFSESARTLGDLKFSHIYDEDLDEHKTFIKLDSYFTEGLRRVPAASSREYLTAALTRNELSRLIDRLKMADFRYEDYDFEESPFAEAPREPDDDLSEKTEGKNDG